MVKPQGINGDLGQRWSQDGDHSGQDEQGDACTFKGGAPAAANPRGQHDGHGLNHLDGISGGHGKDQKEGAHCGTYLTLRVPQAAATRC